MQITFLEILFLSRSQKLISKAKIVSDLTNGAKYDWFVDYSHFSKSGHKKISDKLLSEFQDALQIQ